MTPPILRISDQLLLHASCIEKIFTTLINHHLDEHMIGTTGLLDTRVQKAFQSKIPGCEEHQFKLKSVLQDAYSNARSLTIAWIDLENAYGSVPHKLIVFALNTDSTPTLLNWSVICTPTSQYLLSNPHGPLPPSDMSRYVSTSCSMPMTPVYWLVTLAAAKGC